MLSLFMISARDEVGGGERKSKTRKFNKNLLRFSRKKSFP